MYTVRKWWSQAIWLYSLPPNYYIILPFVPELRRQLIGTPGKSAKRKITQQIWISKLGKPFNKYPLKPTKCFGHNARFNVRCKEYQDEIGSLTLRTSIGQFWYYVVLFLKTMNHITVIFNVYVQLFNKNQIKSK